jgi:hypothetical protein
MSATSMKMNDKGKKLQLAKETLRSLNGAELGQVAGGSFNTSNQVFDGGGGAGPGTGSLHGSICTGIAGTGNSGSFSSVPAGCGSVTSIIGTGFGGGY